MTAITLGEISGVDYPAHMVEGFAVMKAADPNQTKALFDALRKEKMPTEDVKIEDVLKSAAVEDILKALSDEQLEGVVEKAMPAALAAYMAAKKKAEGDAQGAAKDASDKEDDNNDDVTKSLSPDVRAEFAKRDAEIAKRDEKITKMAEQIEIEKSTRLDAAAITEFEKSYTNLGIENAKVAPAIRKFAEVNPEAAEQITTMLKAVNAQADGAIFKELGTASDSAGTSAEAQLDAKANEIEKAENISHAKAFEKAYSQNPQLVAEYYKENN